MSCGQSSPLWCATDLYKFVDLQIREWSSLPNKEELVATIASLNQSFQSNLTQNLECFQALNAFRIRGSQSMTMSDDVEFHQRNWILGNQWVAEQSLEDLFTMGSIVHLNTLLRGERGRVHVRNDAVYVLGDQLLSPHEVSMGMSLLENRVVPYMLSTSNFADQVFAASLFVQVFCMVHPFSDGNGRTSRLLAEAFLLDKGFPPLSYLEHSDSFVFVQTLNQFSYRSILSHIDAMQRSLKILGGLTTAVDEL